MKKSGDPAMCMYTRPLSTSPNSISNSTVPSIYKSIPGSLTSLIPSLLAEKRLLIPRKNRIFNRIPTIILGTMGKKSSQIPDHLSAVPCLPCLSTQVDKLLCDSSSAHPGLLNSLNPNIIVLRVEED
ncbi:unnamed protein product [Allacma fusca]|uniref:Uncharacterized protein n=1 Tax=Allacma fusca TaxID=39272 RepID=A0A8J2KL38_9HEXA|nr:unnamed protein product [Allacma fusca]